MDRCYQINKVKQVPKNYYYGGRKYPGTFNKRILIPCGLDRLEYLGKYIDKNFAVYKQQFGGTAVYPRIKGKQLVEWGELISLY